MAALMMALLLGPLGNMAEAQDNPYKIDNELYEVYMRAYANRNNAKGVAIADTLRRRAIAKHDKKAEILSMIVPLQYELRQPDNFERVDAMSNELRKKSVKYNMLQYYFFTSTIMVNYYVENGKEREALDMLKKDASFAETHDHPYGIMSTMLSMGDILISRQEFAHAIRYYISAINYSDDHLTPSNRTLAYLKICTAYFLHGRYKQMLRFANDALAYAYNIQSRSGLYGYIALADFMLQDFEGYRNAYNEYAKGKDSAPIMRHELEKLLNVLPMIIDGDNYQIRKTEIASRRPYNFYVRYAYNLYNKRYYEAATDMDSITAVIMNGAKDDIVKDMNELYDGVKKRDMAMRRQDALNEQARLQLMHSRLDLNNANLQLGHAEISKRAALLEADRKRIALQNQTIRAEHMQESLAQQQQLNELNRERQKNEEKLFYLTITFLGVVIAVLLIYLLVHRKGKRRLSELSNKLVNIESELRVANEAAQESDRQKTVFLRNMSHEIRTPLNSIVGFSEVLSEMDRKLTEEEKIDMAGRITENSEMLSKLINDILDLTSIESGKYVMKYEDVAVNDLCRVSIDAIQHRKHDGVELLIDSGVDDDFVISTDRIRVQQVLVNLLGNSLKNTSQGSVTLSCSLDAHPGFLTFAVSDTGIGVPPQIINEIFMRFHKEDAFKQGTGLGLAICRAIVTRLGGEVNIDTEYRDGARFWFTIPRENVTEQPEDKSKAENYPPPSQMAKMKRHWWKILDNQQ